MKRRAGTKLGTRVSASSNDLRYWAPLIGLVGGGLTKLISSQSTLLSIAVGVSLATFVLLFGERSITPKLATLEGALTDRDLFQFVQSLIEARELAGDEFASFPECRKFFEQQLRYLYREGLGEWDELKRGRLIIKEDREIKFTSAALSLARSTLRAVSYKEQQFWTDPEGREYLRRQKERIEHGLSITRIFLLPKNDIPEQAPVIREHLTAGVNARVVVLTEYDEEKAEDFNLYDDRYVRSARSFDWAGRRKRATLSISTFEFEEYENIFDELYDKSYSLDEALTLVQQPDDRPRSADGSPSLDA